MNMFLKSTAIAATLAIGATAASANSFALQELVQSDSAVTLDLVTSDTDGSVVIYDYTGGEFGEALGMTEVSEGANNDVIVNLDNNISQELAAVLYNGEVTTPDNAAAWTELDFAD